jgi:asparagine synthase (glutamine-hydrolysing)
MCGIAGLVGGGDRETIEAMCRAVAHRGPDRTGFHEGPGVLLGGCRLRIIDLEEGDQPVYNEDRSVCVVYNGEIYNHRELRVELEKKGHRLSSRADTEVIPHLYEEEGEAFLNRLNGMFAIALWDRKRGLLLLARDPVGIKPLHYWRQGAFLAFASEVKSLLRVPQIPRAMNPQSLHWLMNLRYLPGEATLFEGVRRLMPGHRLRCCAGEVTVGPYHRWDFSPDPALEGEALEEEVRRRLEGAVRRQLESDVPLGVFLSGGIDSSALVALARPGVSGSLRTFTLGFGEPTDELESARRVAEHFGTEHHALGVGPGGLRELPHAVWACEEPRVNQLQGYLLARFASRTVRVALSGLGGDELFGGYDIYRYLGWGDRLRRGVPRFVREGPLRAPCSALAGGIGRWGGFRRDRVRRGMALGSVLDRPERFYLLLRNAWEEEPRLLSEIYTKDFLERIQPGRLIDFFAEHVRPGDDLRSFVLRTEFQTKMVDDFLLNEDRNSMTHSIEARVPFLDLDLVRFALRIPTSRKLPRGRLKGLMKDSLRGILPPWVLDKPKWGFTFSSYHRFQQDLRPLVETLLTEERLNRQGIFRHRYVRRVLDHPPDPRLRWHYFLLWMMTAFQVWEDLFLADRPAADLAEEMGVAIGS